MALSASNESLSQINPSSLALFRPVFSKGDPLDFYVEFEDRLRDVLIPNSDSDITRGVMLGCP